MTPHTFWVEFPPPPKFPDLTLQYGKSAYVNVRSGINRYIMYLRAPPFNRKINLTKDDNYCMDVV